MFDEFRNAFQRHNNGHIQLIIINVVIFLGLAVFRVISTVSGFEEVFLWVHRQLAIPAPLTEFVIKPWTMITYSFVHDLSGILHILFNMLVFYWFAKLIVEYLGSDKLVALYVLGAIAGGVAYLLVYNLIPYYIERIPSGGMVGASAAVYAVTVAAATLMPNYTFFLLFFGPIRIKYIAAFYIVVSFIGSVGSNEGGNIAHLGGALIGFIYIRQLQAGINWGAWVTSTLDWVKALFQPRRNVKVSYRREEKPAPKKTAPGSKVAQDEIDRILDKISAGGYESLTREEKEKLFNASKK
jgi:membrane associated rhomboid family serine protease